MLLAKIREIDCVGCGKCITACPVDAILGAPKFLHTVLTEECIGCKLCIAPCPMDCIEMVESENVDTQEYKLERKERAKKRYQARQQRLIRKAPPALTQTLDPSHKSKIRLEIQNAVNRVQNKLKKVETLHDA